MNSFFHFESIQLVSKHIYWFGALYLRAMHIPARTVPNPSDPTQPYPL